MTEDQSIEDYSERKAEHRSRMTRSGRVASIYAADKLAHVRELADSQQIAYERLDHYVETLHVLRDSRPELPFLADLHAELERVFKSN